MSKETGISVETLSMIKTVEKKVEDNRRKNELFLEEQSEKKNLQMLVHLAGQIRFYYQMKRTTTMPLNGLV